MSKIIMHLDLNMFFVSCELLRHPELKNKPIAVGGPSRRGVISTSSYEARKKGVFSAMPIYLAKKNCPELVILNGDYKYYQELSKKFFTYLISKTTSKIEMASIDEAFLDMTDILKNNDNPYDYLKALQLDLKNETGLGCSIGIGTTKFIAKMASDIKKPMGITIIRNKDIEKILFPLPIKDLFGIGKKSQEKLSKLKIKTIKDFYFYDESILKPIMGKYLYELKKCLEGKSSSEVIDYEIDPKSISTSSTFMFDTNSYDEIVDTIKIQVKDIFSQLKKRNMVGYTLSLTLRNNEFKTKLHSKTFETPFDSEERVLEEILKIFDANYNNDEIRLVGVSISSLKEKKDTYVQMNLFSMKEDQERFKTKLLINSLNRKCDKTTFMRLSDLKKENN